MKYKRKNYKNYTRRICQLSTKPKFGVSEICDYCKEEIIF
jgi:hypothetical protein